MIRETTTEKIKLVWDFIEKYYPKYYQCDNIAENDDLSKIVKGELNGQALEMYNKELSDRLSYWRGSIPEQDVINEVLERFQQRLHKSNAFVLEKAVDAYIERL
jgi:hypothetical protein